LQKSFEQPEALKVNNFRKKYKDYMSALKGKGEDKNKALISVEPKELAEEEKREKKSQSKNDSFSKILVLLEVMNQQMKMI